jgi:sugar phosphate isomerase/epimerase
MTDIGAAGAESVDASAPLFLWAACVMGHDLLARCDAVQAGEFIGMSILCADFVDLEERHGWSPARVASELQARDTRALVIDPYLDWYPGWDAPRAAGPHARGLRATESDVLRYADAMGARSMSVLGPFEGPAAPEAAVVDALGAFADRAAEHGLRLHVEVIPTSHIPDLPTGWRIVEAVDRPNVGLVLDTFHLGRSACDPELLDSIPLDKVFHVQLCDGPAVPSIEDFFEEAVTSRLFAGDGELNAAEYVRHLLRDGSHPQMGPEVPSDQLSALAPAAAGRLCAEKTHAFLDDLRNSSRRGSVP